jgi:hypothetical protein
VACVLSPEANYPASNDLNSLELFVEQSRRSGWRESNPRGQLGRLALSTLFAGSFFTVGTDLGKSHTELGGFWRI